MGDVIALVKAANLVVANDSAPIHLASAVGVPVVALFGPTDPRRFGPYPMDEGTNIVLGAPDGDLASLSCEDVMAAVGSILE